VIIKTARKNPVAKIDEDIFARLSRIEAKTFNTNTEITVKEVLEVDATAPSVIGFKVPVVFPLSPGENLGSPQTDVKLIIGVPLGAGRRCYLLHFLPGIGLSSKSDRRDDPKP